MRLWIDTKSLDSYRQFLGVKSLPTFRFTGDAAVFPDEYAERIGVEHRNGRHHHRIHLIDGLFDYQRAIIRIALEKQRFCVFADCGLGKTLMFLEYARNVIRWLPKGRCILIISPLMVVRQTMAECEKFYGGRLALKQLHAANLAEWMLHGRERIGITNYDALKHDTPQGRLGALILDESSMLKSHYGKWGGICLRLGRGLQWKMACTGTPAPNDRIEYANHAVFMDAFRTVNSFLARFFVNRGQTDNRWVLKPHAVQPFYRALSHWCIFLTNPRTYGWHDNCETIPPIIVHTHHVPLTTEQQNLVYGATGRLFADQIGGITSRSVLSQIAKGNHRGKPVATNKTAFIRHLLDQWPDESTIIWCIYNREQELLARAIPEAANIAGNTPLELRQELIDEFKSGVRRVLISKPRILGFGLNLHRATRQIFSGLMDSYESYYQAVKRSNRYGSTRPLNVHIPVTDIERPMIETVLCKAQRVQQDTEEQELLFHDTLR